MSGFTDARKKTLTDAHDGATVASLPLGHLVRLECLKLAHAHGRETKDVLDRAKEYEGYVTGQSAPLRK